MVKKMLPIAPLMIEHRLIERMIGIIEKELQQLQSQNPNSMNLPLLKHAVEFIQFYADKTHHGKEEDILFRELKTKQMKESHTQTMNHLIEEHKFGRKTTGNLRKALNKFESGDQSQLIVIREELGTLVEFYPQHIDTEDNHFFKEVMQYFSAEEQQTILNEGRVFDRKMIHRRYLQMVQNYEHTYFPEKASESDENWLEFM